MAAPDAAALGAFLGRTVDSAQAASVIQVITSLAKSYTRGQGFTDAGPNDEISAVILTASARLISNSSGLQYSESEGPSAVEFRSVFSGWALPELFVLNRFRVRAC